MGLATTTTAINTDPTRNITLRAYDCSQPFNLNNIDLDTTACQTDSKEETRPEETFSITQKQSQHRADGHICRKTISRFTFICTNSFVAAHQRLAAIPEIELPTKVTPEECQELISKQKWVGPDGVQHNVPMGKTTILTFYETGRQETNGNTITCVGESVKIGDRVMEGIAILDQMKLQVKPTAFKFDTMTGWGEVREDHIMLPTSCRLFNHHCQTDTATYIWGVVEPTRYQKINHFWGRIIQQEGQEVLISKSQKIRLVLGETTKDAGRDYRSTKYEGIFVTTGEAEYLDPFPSDHLKLGSYINARDDYLAYALEQKILQAVDMVRHSSCRRTQDLARTQMNLAAHSDDGLQYLNTGDNQFGVLWGESLHTFNCKEVMVNPRRTNVCSKELPVSQGQLSRYLQPISRILTDHATIVPCSTIMAAKFKTDQHRWITANPALRFVEAPNPFPNQQQKYTLNHTEFSTGGIYTSEQVAEFSKLLQFPKLRQVLKSSMVNELCVEREHQLCHSLREQIGLEVIQRTNIFNFRQRILNFLHKFGETAAIFISIWILAQAAYWIAGLVINFINLREVRGIRKILQLLCPVWLVNYDYGQMAAGARRRQQEEQLQRQEEMRDLTEEQVIQERED